MAETREAGRIASMDQFRGYTVAGMFVVNFLGGLAVVHPLLKHNQNYFSYADSIMPSFLFACGFSYRLSVLRRLPRLGGARTALGVVGRGLTLVLLSLVIFGPDMEFKSWAELSGTGAREVLARLLKAHLWEVLAIIGVVQILLLPVIAAGPRVRLAALVGLAALHVALSEAFNYDFVYGRPNALDAWWGAATTKAWDGGAFGLISWAIPMLAGSLAYDAAARLDPPAAARWLLLRGLAFLLIAYGLSCLATLYEPATRPDGSPAKVAARPVRPPFEAIGRRGLVGLLAPPPFVPPPPPEARPASYWLMDKKVASLPFMLFGTGFALALYAPFVLACDSGGFRLGLFGLLGRNPLAAYVAHEIVLRSIGPLMPKDAPLWWSLLGLAAFLAVTLAIVRYLDRRGYVFRL